MIRTRNILPPAFAAAVSTPDTASDSAVAPYANAYYEYDSLRRVTKLTQDKCGCSATSSMT
jgi:hypothetical protein